jgi:hypothetical protein
VFGAARLRQYVDVAGLVEDSNLSPHIGRTLAKPGGELSVVLTHEALDMQVATTACDPLTDGGPFPTGKKDRLVDGVPSRLVRPHDGYVVEQQAAIIEAQATLHDGTHATAVPVIPGGEQ